MKDKPAEPSNDATQVAMRPDHHGLGVDHPAERPKKKRGAIRQLARLFVLLLALVGLLAVLAPMLLSTKPGTSLLVSLINDRIDGELAVDDLQLGWLKGQRALGATYTDKQAGLTATIGEVRADELGLLDWLTGGRELGEVRVVDAKVVYDQPDERPQTTTRTEDATQTRETPEPFKLPKRLNGSLVFENLSIDYTAADQQPVALSLRQGRLDIPGIRDIAFDFAVDLKQGERTGELTLKGELLNLFSPDGVIQPLQAAYQADARVEGVPTVALGRLLSGMRYNNAVLNYLLGKKGRLAALLGEGALDAEANLAGTVSELSLKLYANTPNFQANFYTERDGDTLLASPKSTAELDLTPAAFDALFPDTTLELIESARIDLSKLDLKLPSKGDTIDWDTASTSILVKVADEQNFALRDQSGQVVGIEALRLGGGGKSIAEKLAFKASATLAAVDPEGNVTREPVAAELILTRPLDRENEFEFFSAGLPVDLADALLGMDDQLVLYLGEMLELQAVVRGKLVTDDTGRTRVSRTFELRPGPIGRVTGEVTGEFDAQRYIVQTPDARPLEAVLVPEAFASLMELVSGRKGKPALTINKPMPVLVSLRTDERPISIATDPSKHGVQRFYPDVDRTFVGATIELTPATVYDPNRETTYELRGGTLAISAKDLRGMAKISAELQLWVPPTAGEEGLAGLLSWQTDIGNLLDSDGGIPLDWSSLMQQVALAGGVTLENTPSGLFDSLLNRDGDIASVLGPVVQQMDASFTYDDGRPTGATLKLNWDDKNNRPIPGSWASMKPAKFDIDDNQMLTSRGGQDLELEVRVSEEFGDRWMGQLHPILFDAKSGDRPVNIKIDGGSFQFPMNDKTMKGARVEAQVDLGSVEFGEDALLGKLLKWTDHQGDRAVFEPAKVTLVDGKIAYEQFDLAVGNVKLRLDGEVDLVDGEIVDMAVRVPGSSLIRVFNELDGVIPEDDFLSFPMSGPIRQPTLDQKRFNEELTRLITRGVVERQKQNLKDKLREEIGVDVGEPGSAFIDGALDLLLGGRKKRADN